MKTVDGATYALVSIGDSASQHIAVLRIGADGEMVVGDGLRGDPSYSEGFFVIGDRVYVGSAENFDTRLGHPAYVLNARTLALERTLELPWDEHIVGVAQNALWAARGHLLGVLNDVNGSLLHQRRYQYPPEAVWGRGADLFVETDNGAGFGSLMRRRADGTRLAERQFGLRLTGVAAVPRGFVLVFRTGMMSATTLIDGNTLLDVAVARDAGWTPPVVAPSGGVIVYAPRDRLLCLDSKKLHTEVTRHGSPVQAFTVRNRRLFGAQKVNGQTDRLMYVDAPTGCA